MPSKRERGKQRKVAKNLAAGNGNDSIKHIVAKLRKGNHDTTILLGDGSPKHSLEESNGILYEQSGILSTVLKFLKRCEDDTFVKVMLDIGGGNLKTPGLWVRILVKAEIQEESCRLQIAQSIGPLVRCMCDDMKRQFFKSNEHWVNTIHAFVCLIHNMWGFWDEEYRPDVTKELSTEDRVIVDLGKATLNRLIRVDPDSEEGRERLETIGTTPVISKEYDPECTISFVVGLIRQTKIEGWTIETSNTLQYLTTNGGCVDKNVIIEMIDLGMDTSNDEWAIHVAELLRFIVLKENSNEKYYANDTRAAFAVRGGLVELCLRFIDRFGVLESFDKEKDNLSSHFVSIESMLSNIYWIGLHKKTAKAIRHKRCSIEQELTRLEQNVEVTNNVNCKKLLEIARSILDTNGSYCCRCNKSLSRTEVKLCNGCGLMIYCSRACQREDWSNGHKLACCKTYTDQTVGQFQGRLKPMTIPVDERAATKLEAFEINLSSVQLKLFLDHSETILNQAKDLGASLSDCVVKFDLAYCLLRVTTHKYTDFYDTPELKRGFEDSRSKENITCIFISSIFDGSFSLVEARIPSLDMQRLFPHKWLSKRKAHE